MKFLLGLTLFLLLGTYAIAQDPSIEGIKPLTFKTHADLDAWIDQNPLEYERLKSAANQVSATYVGNLIVVEEITPKELKGVRPSSTEAVKDVVPINRVEAPAAFPTSPNLEGFPVKKNTGDAEADQKRYEEAKRVWYEQNKIN